MGYDKLDLFVAGFIGGLLTLIVISIIEINVDIDMTDTHKASMYCDSKDSFLSHSNGDSYYCGNGHLVTGKKLDAAD